MSFLFLTMPRANPPRDISTRSKPARPCPLRATFVGTRKKFQKERSRSTLNWRPTAPKPNWANITGGEQNESFSQHSSEVLGDANWSSEGPRRLAMLFPSKEAPSFNHFRTSCPTYYIHPTFIKHILPHPRIRRTNTFSITF
jgi:hypothetical protein